MLNCFCLNHMHAILLPIVRKKYSQMPLINQLVVIQQVDCCQDVCLICAKVVKSMMCTIPFPKTA